MFIQRLDEKKSVIVAASGEEFPISRSVEEKIGDLTLLFETTDVKQFMSERAEKLNTTINKFDYYEKIWDFLQKNEIELEATDNDYQKYDELIKKLQSEDKYLEKGTTVVKYSENKSNVKLFDEEDSSLTHVLTQGITLSPHTKKVTDLYRYVDNGRDGYFYVSGTKNLVTSNMNGINLSTKNEEGEWTYKFGNLKEKQDGLFDFEEIYERTFKYKYSDIGQLIYLTKYGLADYDLKSEYQSHINAIMYSVVAQEFKDALQELNMSSDVTIVPFPSNSTEYNHVVDIARKLATTNKLKYADIFQKNTTQKGKYLKLAESYEEKAFSLKEDVFLPDTDILLFDDLYGTGKTLRELLKVVENQNFKHDIYFMSMTRIEGTGFGGKNDEENN